MLDPVTYALEVTQTKPIDLARQLDLSRQYISRAQLGCHVNLNKRLIQWIQVSTAREFDSPLSRTQVRNWYETFKLKKRQDSFDRIKPALISYRLAFVPQPRLGPEVVEDINSFLGVSTLDTLEDYSSQSPVANLDCVDFRTKFINWRKDYWSSTYRFASDMCIHPASVDNFENGTVRGIPGDLKTVLDWMANYSRE